MTGLRKANLALALALVKGSRDDKSHWQAHRKKVRDCSPLELELEVGVLLATDTSCGLI